MQIEKTQSQPLVSKGLDLPKGLLLSDLEVEILRGMASKKRVKIIAAELGIPIASINTFLKRDGVKEFVQEMIDARNLALKMELPDLLVRIIEDKIDLAEEEGLSLGETTKKDIVDVIKQLNDLLKTTDSSQAKQEEDSFTKIYQSINVIQG